MIAANKEFMIFPSEPYGQSNSAATRVIVESSSRDRARNDSPNVSPNKVAFWDVRQREQVDPRLPTN